MFVNMEFTVLWDVTQWSVVNIKLHGIVSQAIVTFKGNNGKLK